MKKLVLLLLFPLQVVLSQQPYYDDVDLSLTGQDLYFELQQKISNASGSFNYGDVKLAFFEMDNNPENGDDVLLIYGYNDGDGNCTTDRSRNKQAFGGTNCEYNREHTFARSNTNPTMGDVSNSTTGIGADPQNLRPSDQQANNNKGNKKFAAGAGNAGDVTSGNWYPGDEWRGDVARILMYMYTRYGDRCIPSLQAVGSLEPGTDMMQILLQWNAEDEVSALEMQRNPYLEQAYGNRNPFIDQPQLATIIWGGPEAQDIWATAGVNDISVNDFSVFPNPTSERLWIESTSQSINTVSLYDGQGRQVFATDYTASKGIDLSAFTTGMYFLKIENEVGVVTKKVVVK
jgi:hypothetical protein